MLVLKKPLMRCGDWSSKTDCQSLSECSLRVEDISLSLGLRVFICKTGTRVDIALRGRPESAWALGFLSITWTTLSAQHKVMKSFS